VFQDAIAKYEVVLQNLDFARDLHKQFQMMLQEVMLFGLTLRLLPCVSTSC